MDYTKVGTRNPAPFDELQHLAGLVRDTNYVTAFRLGDFETDLPQHLTTLDEGFRGTTILADCFPRLLLGGLSPFLPLPAGIPNVMALV